MADLYDPAFWSEEERRFWETVAPTLVKLVFAGGVSGAQALPRGMRDLVDWDNFNQSALDFLHAYRLSTVSNISATSRRQAMAAIERWIERGDPLPVLEAQLNSVFGRARGARIAVTEVTRIYARGNQIAWTSSGVISSNQWRTANDELVCPYCGPLNNQTVALGGEFTTVNRVVVSAPPLHPRCRCWLSPVVSEDMLRNRLRQAFGWFGDQVERYLAEIRADGMVIR